jgi:hypothetical protein
MEEISKLGWLIGFVKPALWADPFYFLYTIQRISPYGLSLVIGVDYV